MEKRILAAEDDPGVQLVLKNTLGQDFDITVVGDGLQILSILEHDPNFDLILLDLDLPAISGMDVLDHVRKSPKLRHLPVIILTGNRELSTQLKAFHNDAILFMRKPFLPSQLKTIVCSALRK